MNSPTATELIEARLSSSSTAGRNEHDLVHTEVEFVCHNTEYPSSTPLQRQINLHQELSKVPGLLSYRQDFSHYEPGHRQVSHAVIIPDMHPNHNHDELLAMVKKKAREHGVDIDLVDKVSDRKVLDVNQGNVEGYIKS